MGEPEPPAEDRRREAQSGMTRSAQNTDGPGVRRWGRIPEMMDRETGLGRGQGVYGSTPVPSAMMS